MGDQSLVRMNRRRLRATLLLAGGLTLCSQSASGLGGSAPNGGSFLTRAAPDTGAREWVVLRETGSLWSGWPQHSAVALITVDAPGADGRHLILRELAASGGKRALLLSAPASLAQHALRVTLYVKHRSKNLVLFEYVEGSWKHRRPQPLHVAVAGGQDADPDHLLAFSVAGLGLYWLVESHSLGMSELAITLQEPSASALVGGGVSRGVLPGLWSALLLLAGWALSRWVHGIERRTGK